MHVVRNGAAHAGIQAQFVAAYEALSDGELDKYAALLDPQVITISPGLGNPTGRDAALTELRALLDAFPDLEFTVQEVIATPDRTCARLVADGTHGGQWGRHAPTNRLVHLAMCEVAEWLDGHIITRQVYWDRHAVLQQLELA